MTALRIGVDATSWVNRRGFGRFARNAVSRLVELDPGSEYVLYIDDQTAAEAALPERATVRTVPLSRAPSVAASADGSRSVADLLRLRRAVAADRLDAFLFPSVYTFFPVARVPTLVGLHDTILDDLPDLTLPSRSARVKSRLKYSAAIRRARYLFTVSETSRAALAERLRMRPDQLAVVPEAPAAVFAPRAPEALAAGLAAIGLSPDDRFFVYAGGISPHKNVERLVDAYAALVRTGDDAPLLVLAGELDGAAFLSAAASVRSRIADHGLGQRVRLPGFVSDETLACLYGGAVAAVIPSLAEGFGLPAVEAAACGAPVLLSDLGPHRETLDGAALFFSPTDTPALTDGLATLSRDATLRAVVAARCQEAVAGLTWDASAMRLQELLRRTALRA
jgi:glycosyltransferase involved in cell wall biosynthesis